MLSLPHITKAKPYLRGFQNITSVSDEREIAPLTMNILPYGSTKGWASRKISFMFSNFINVFPSPILSFSLFLLAWGLCCLFLAAPALFFFFFSLHWMVSLLNIVRISCSLSWHCFLKETFPFLVQSQGVTSMGRKLED